MASKFQNRLAGTIVLFAIGVIVLPSLLDGEKKKYQEDFAAIPLVPKLGDPIDNRSLQPIEPLPDVAKKTLDNTQSTLPSSPELPQNMQQDNGNDLTSAKDLQQVETQQQALQPASNEQRNQIELPQEETQHKIADNKQQDSAERKLEQQRALAILNGLTPPPATKHQPKPETGQSSYILQLGVLKNANRVNELVSTLRTNGFNAYSIPAPPLANHENRILLGPSDSKDQLKRLQAKIKLTLKLDGIIMTNPANKR